ncbi:MAG TPA: hypothetical protein VJ400_05915 [Thermoplasmata archaeon]|nr:hypothetical protein [Thermoplasmata archaeon]
MDLDHARLVCEACYLGVAVDGMKSTVNPNVQGVGIGYRVVHRIPTKEKGIQIYVKRKVHERLLRPEDRIPPEIEGAPTDVVETGVFSIGRKFPPVYHRRIRPAPAGVSIGHKDVSAGTFGALVREGREVRILSNNHVLANENRGKAGDPVLQPGRYDGGRPDRDTIAKLSGFVALEPDATNLVDAAVATPLAKDDVAPEVLHIGVVRGGAEPEIDVAVRKSGRTTRLTEGTITATDVTLRVGYSDGTLVFTDQFLISGDRAFSGPGDSGALVVDAQNRAVGLLFAGSPFVSVANRWTNVVKALKAGPLA